MFSGFNHTSWQSALVPASLLELRAIILKVELYQKQN